MKNNMLRMVLSAGVLGICATHAQISSIPVRPTGKDPIGLSPLQPGSSLQPLSPAQQKVLDSWRSCNYIANSTDAPSAGQNLLSAVDNFNSAQSEYGKCVNSSGKVLATTGCTLLHKEVKRAYVRMALAAQDFGTCVEDYTNKSCPTSCPSIRIRCDNGPIIKTKDSCECDRAFCVEPGIGIVTNCPECG